MFQLSNSRLATCCLVGSFAARPVQTYVLSPSILSPAPPSFPFQWQKYCLKALPSAHRKLSPVRDANRESSLRPPSSLPSLAEYTGVCSKRVTIAARSSPPAAPLPTSTPPAPPPLERETRHNKGRLLLRGGIERFSLKKWRTRCRKTTQEWGGLSAFGATKRNTRLLQERTGRRFVQRQMKVLSPVERRNTVQYSITACTLDLSCVKPCLVCEQMPPLAR